MVRSHTGFKNSYNYQNIVKQAIIWFHR